MKTIYELLKFRANMHPTRKALFFEGDSFSYSDLLKSTNQIVNYLLSLEIKKGDKFSILDFNTPSTLHLLFAANALGAIPIILNWRLTPREIEFILVDAKVKTLFYGNEFEEIANKIDSKRIPVSSVNATLFSSIFLKEDILLSKDDIFVELYTSGTTGFPKGVPLSNKNLLSVVRNLATELPGFGADSINLVCAPFFHIGGVGYSLLTLYIGGENILFRKFDPLLVIKAIEERKITNALLVPAMLQAILHLPELGKFNFSSLRNIQHGGSPISEIILRKAKKIFQCYFTGAYGLTETSGIASLLRFDVQEKGLAECATREDIHRLSSVGKPSPEMDICIKKESGEKVKANELGEVCIKGEYVFSGYANSQGLEQNEFDEENWFHTGDIGLLDEEGYLFLFDRKNDMILSKSENIYPIEVERVLATHPDIVEVAVVGIPGNEYGEIVTAFLVLRPGTNIDYSEIRGFSKNSLASFKIPRQIFIVNEIPRNLSGKILRNELKDRFN